MNNLQQVINTMQRGLDNGFVFTHVTKPELQTLLNGLEEAQREIERMYTTNNSLQSRYNVRCERIEELELELKILKDDRTAAIKDFEELKRENATMKEALEWYGDAENYSIQYYYGDNPDEPDDLESPMDADDGEKARTVLSTLKCTD